MARLGTYLELARRLRATAQERRPLAYGKRRGCSPRLVAFRRCAAMRRPGLILEIDVSEHLPGLADAQGLDHCQLIITDATRDDRKPEFFRKPRRAECGVEELDFYCWPGHRRRNKIGCASVSFTRAFRPPCQRTIANGRDAGTCRGGYPSAGSCVVWRCLTSHRPIIGVCRYLAASETTVSAHGVPNGSMKTERTTRWSDTSASFTRAY